MQRSAGEGNTSARPILVSGVKALVLLAAAGSCCVHPVVSAGSSASDPTGWPRELHVVGAYEGRERGFQDHASGDGAVLVNRPGKRVTLFLSSYEAIRWHVTLAEGSLVERVFVSGYNRQTVVDLPPEVPVMSTSWEEGSRDYLIVGWDLDSQNAAVNLPKVRGLTGLEVASYHGAYRTPYPQPFVVDRVQDDPRLRRSYPEPSTAGLPNLEFRLAFSQASSGPGNAGVFFRDYTLAGPKGRDALLPRGVPVVGPQGGELYYGIDGHSVVEVSSATRTAKKMQLGSQVPELSWPVGITYDTMRQRVLLASLGGKGVLYGYDTLARQWSTVASMNDLDLDSLVYHEKQDMLYGLGNHHSSGSMRLYRLSPNGTALGYLTLPAYPFSIGPGSNGSELASVGDYLVLLLAQDQYYSASGESPEERMYVIEPASERVWLTYRRWPGVLDNTAPTVRLIAPEEGATFKESEVITLAAEAGDSDGRVTFVEFFANDQSVGLGRLTDQWMPGPKVAKLFWQGMPAGSYRLTARACDQGGASTMSAPVCIRVGDEPPPPRVIVVSPADGAEFVAPADVLIEARATDADVKPSQYEFRIDSLVIGASWLIVLPPMPAELEGAPSTSRFVLKGMPTGEYRLAARGIFADGMAESPAVHFRVASGAGLFGLEEGKADGPGVGAGVGRAALQEIDGAAPRLHLAGTPGGRPGAVEFAFKAAPTESYAIECTDSLSSGAWRVLTRYATGGALARSVTVSDRRASGEQRFYRLRLVGGE